MSELARQPKEIVREFARNAEILKALSAAVQPYVDREAALKLELIEAMKATGVKSYADKDIQWEAKFVTKNLVKILDPDAVEEELIRLNRIDEVLETKLNADKIKEIAKELKVLLPGMVNSASEYVTVSPIKPNAVLAPAPEPEPASIVADGPLQEPSPDPF